MAPSPSPTDPNLENPYAPPGSTFAPEVPPHRLSPVSFNVGELFTRAWFLYRSDFRNVMRLTLASLGVNYGINILLTLLMQAGLMAFHDEVTVKLIQIAAMFGSFVVQTFIGIGLTIALFKVARRQPVGFEDLFRGAPHVLAVILATILFLCSVATPILLGYLAITGLFLGLGEMVTVAFLAAVPITVVAVAVSLYLATRLGQYYFAVIDWNAGVLDCSRISWQLTRHEVPTIFLVYMLWLAIYLVGSLFLMLGFLGGLPLPALILLFMTGIVLVTPLANLLLIVTFIGLTAHVIEDENSALDQRGPHDLKG